MALTRDTLTRPVEPDDHAHGPVDAPITLVEYGDYACLRCRHAHLILHRVLEEVGENVRFVFRNFPRAEAHPHAVAAAEAAEAVAMLGGEEAFWTFHNLLFENQDALQPDDLIEYAAAAGVDPAAVADALATGAFSDRVSRDVQSGIQSGVDDTPTFFVNGRRFVGDWTNPDSLSDALQDGTPGRTYTTH